MITEPYVGEMPRTESTDRDCASEVKGLTMGALNLNTIVRNSGLSYLSTVLMMAIVSLTKIVLARSLAPSDLTLFLAGQTLVGLAATLAQLSVPEALVRFLGVYCGAGVQNGTALVRTALWTGLAGSTLLTLCISLGAGVISSAVYHQHAIVPVLVLLAFAMPMNLAAIVLGSAYRGIVRVLEKLVLVDLVPAISILVALLILAALGWSSLRSVAWTYAIAAAISASLMARRFTTDDRWTAEGGHARAKDLLRYSLPLLGANLVAWPIASIPLILAATGRPEGVAYYNLAISLSSLIYTLVSAAEMAALPVWSSQIGRGLRATLRADYASTTSWCFMAGSVVFVLLFLCPAAVIRTMYGVRYEAGAPALRLIASIYFLKAATGPNESLLKAFGDTKWIFATRLAAGAAVLCSAALMISAWGLIGAVVSYLLSTLIGIVMYSGYLYIKRGLHPVSIGYLKIVIASVLSVAGTAIVRNILHSESDLVTLKITAAIYLSILTMLLLLTGYMRSDDAKTLVYFFNGVRWRFLTTPSSSGS